MAPQSLFYGRVKKIHFVGIGGIGMSGIAEVLLDLGFEVHGSDLGSNDTTKRLGELGATIFLGHSETNLIDADVVVISSAVKADNPEVKKAFELGIPVIPRAEMLAQLMRFKHGIAISGSHGKTTTTSLVASILQEAKLDPTVVIGGKVNHMGTNAMLGHGEFLVAEADESDGSFLLLSPSIAVITNLDPEHLDYFRGGITEIKEKFVEFAHRLPFYGLVVACEDSPHVQSILPHIKRRQITYGFKETADFYAKNIVHDGPKTYFEVWQNGKNLGQLKLQVVGKHNVLNALAAVAVGFEVGIDFITVKAALERFTGVWRRFSLIGEHNQITVIDDYGHHPTEIQAVLEAASVTFPGRRIVTLFQPHRFTRTKHLMGEFARCFDKADVVNVTDIYAASEPPLEGVNSEKLVGEIKKWGHKNANYAGQLEDATMATARLLQKGDVVITLGAGSITQSAPKLLNWLKDNG